MNKQKFNASVKELLNSASSNDRRIMEEGLKTLGLEIKDEAVGESRKHIKERYGDIEAVGDAKATTSTKLLQEEISKNAKLESELAALKEQLAVSDAKAKALEEELRKHEMTASKLGGVVIEARRLKKEQESVAEKLASNESEISSLKVKNASLTENVKKALLENKALKESESAHEAKLADMSKAFETEKTDLSKKLTESVSTANKFKKLAEQYKKLAHSVAERYISSKASMLGITANEIKNKLNESYSLDDVDDVCEQLQTRSINIGRLPFQLSNGAKVKITESKNEPLREAVNRFVDDEVDDTLMSLAGLDK